MERLYRPYWLFLTVTLPQLLLLVLLSRVYYIIDTELSVEALGKWRIFSMGLLISLISSTLYGFWLLLKKKKTTPYWGVGLIFWNLVLLVVYFFGEHSLVPSSIPSWMMMGISPAWATLTLIMPALGHGMLLMVHWHIDKYGLGSLPQYGAYMVGIPFLWYIGGNLAFSVFEVHNMTNLVQYMIIMVFVLSIVLFFFLFVRILYGMLMKKSTLWQKYLLFVVLVGSLGGLVLNQSLYNLFGNFSHPLFYLLNLLTIAVIWFPQVDRPNIRLALFIAKSITFVYTLYFAMVFLPYLPLSILAMMFFGLGVLMLMPLILLFLHTQSLWIDYQYFKISFKGAVPLVLFVAGLMMIPMVVGVTVAQDKIHIDRALQYVYQRSYEEHSQKDLNLRAMKRALGNLKYSREPDSDIFSIDNNIPYLTALYNHFVLDNLTISNDKINRLEAIFYGSDFDPSNQEADLGGRVQLTKAEAETTFDEAEGIYRSWVHLSLKNNSLSQEEYSTILQLPQGSYISNYYLYVGQHKKYGLIADKRAANWAYQQIKNIRKDPGLLTYLTDDLVEFKVFPFEAMEKRDTGIEITHRLPMELEVDGVVLQLGEPQDKSPVTAGKALGEYPWLTYITKEEKEGLDNVKRQPRYYFLVDYSKGNEKNIAGYHGRVKEYIGSHNLGNNTTEVVAVNYQEKFLVQGKDWETLQRELPLQGGFNLDYSIKKIYYKHYMENSDHYPVVIVVTDYFDRAIKPESFHEFQFTAPEGENYYHLEDTGRLSKYSLMGPPLLMGKQEIIDEPPVVLHWQAEDDRSFYLPDNQQDSVLLLNPKFHLDQDGKISKWEAGTLLKGMHMAFTLQPERSPEITLDMVKTSILNEVMGPMTSFIVLETEAQEKAMLQKQKDILGTDKPLDINDFVQMDEPPVLIVGLLLGWVLLIKKRKRT